jgi:HPr kinase/phosphorylase
MKNAITPAVLFETHRQRLELVWVAGKAGAGRGVSPAAETSEGFPPVGWAGYMNLVRPHRIQVIGAAEAAYLSALAEDERSRSLARLFAEAPVFVIVAGGQPVPPGLAAMADETATPLLSSTLAGYEIISQLRYHLADAFAERTTLHGVFMAVLGIGVLLTGESGVGKSEVALDLLSRGHRLIADDAPEFRRIAPDVVSGYCCPPVLGGFLEVRGLGVLDVRAMFGDTAIKTSKSLRLIIELKRMSEEELNGMDRLQGSRRACAVLGVKVPGITLPVVPGRNLAVLVESAVSNQILLMKGYDAAGAFIERQQRAIVEHAS